MKVLLVEDEREVALPLGDYLVSEGYRVEIAATLAEARALSASSYDLILLDWMLPDGQGIELLRGWRAAGVAQPVIFLTARDELVDRVLGLELGADDYVTKPFERRELLARIHARTRSHRALRKLATGRFSLDLERRLLHFDGAPVELTLKELELLRLFMESPHKVFSRDELLNKVWGYDSFPTTRTVDTHILQLRQKTAADAFETVRGVGYRFVGES